MSVPPLLSSALEANAFWVLGVTVRDDRLRIAEAADDRALELDTALCQRLRSELTAPRTRLPAEIAWLPGLSPARAADLVRQLPLDIHSLCAERGLPTLAHANLLASSLERQDGNGDSDAVSAAISHLAILGQDIDVESVIRLVNEDRAIAGFPEVRDPDVVQQELLERRRQFRDVIRSVLERTPSTTLVAIVTSVVERETRGGRAHAPELVHELVDSYEVSAQPFLEREAANVDSLAAAIAELAKHGVTAIHPLVQKLEQVVRNWDRIAQPVQLSHRARGFEHDASHDLHARVRDLAVALFNEHRMLATSQRLNSLLGAVFAEVPRLFEMAEEDARVLRAFANEQRMDRMRDLPDKE